MKSKFWLVAMAIGLLMIVGCGDDGTGADEATEVGLDYDDAAAEMWCACFYEEDGFSSEGECYGFLGVHSETRQELVSCVRDADQGVETERPEGVGQYFDCLIDAAEEATDCVQGIDIPDQCGDAQVDEFNGCQDILLTGNDDCTREAEEDADVVEWLNEYRPAANQCF